jgi:hypothetical protein
MKAILISQGAIQQALGAGLAGERPLFVVAWASRSSAALCEMT